MLHNTGPYGPNDGQINMGAPVNMSQIPGVNISHNLNNLNKIVQPPTPSPSGQFMVPEYTNHGQLPPSMSAQMHQCQGYRQIGFHQHLPSQPHVINHNTHWNNGMLPMNLNVYNEPTVQVENLNRSLVKKPMETPMIIDQPNKVMPINIPQIQTKAFHKQGNNDDYFNDTYNNHHDNNLDLRVENHEKVHLDETRRKSLENTVKLIENILINTTAKRDAQINMQETKQAHMNNRQLIHSSTTDIKQPQLMNEVDKQTDKVTNNKNDIIPRISIENLHKSIISANNTHSKMMKHTDISRSHNKNKSYEEKDVITNERAVNFTNKNVEEKVRHISDNKTLQEGDNSSSDGDKTSEDSINNDTNEIDCETQNREYEMRFNKLRSALMGMTQRYSVKSKAADHMKIDGNDSENDPLSNNDDWNGNIKPNVNDLSANGQAFSSVVVKIENTVEEGDMGDPFLKDIHGIPKDSIGDNCDIIEAAKSVDEAKEAIKNGQNNTLYYECSDCSLLFKHPKRFLIHTKWHSFGQTQAMKEEIRREKEMRRNERREERVIKHMNSKEVTEEKGSVGGKIYPCGECDKVFSTKGSLKNHKQRFHVPHSKECRICHITVTGWNEMRTHMATHVIQTSEGFQCTECPKKFKYMHSLVKHKGTHMEKTHPCPECPKMFGSEILVKLHMKSHERVQRGATHRCSYCGKGFFESYNLTVHERTHRNERPFSCDICGTSFGTKSSLKRHLKVSHNALKPFECPQCHRFFVSAAIRDRHLSRNHGKPEDFKFPCELCPCKYLKLKDLQKHEYKVHPKQTQGKRKRKLKVKEPKVKMEDDDVSD